MQGCPGGRLPACEAASEAEEQRLQRAPGRGTHSRLGRIPRHAPGAPADLPGRAATALLAAAQAACHRGRLPSSAPRQMTLYLWAIEQRIVLSRPLDCTEGQGCNGVGGARAALPHDDGRACCPVGWRTAPLTMPGLSAQSLMKRAHWRSSSSSVAHACGGGRLFSLQNFCSSSRRRPRLAVPAAAGGLRRLVPHSAARHASGAGAPQIFCNGSRRSSGCWTTGGGRRKPRP